MTTSEATISMVSKLTEPELLSVQAYIKRIFSFRKTAAKLQPITETAFLQSIEKSDNDIKNGRVKSWAQVRAETREKYGL